MHLKYKVIPAFSSLFSSKIIKFSTRFFLFYRLIQKEVENDNGDEQFVHGKNYVEI